MAVRRYGLAAFPPSWRDYQHHLLSCLDIIAHNDALEFCFMPDMTVLLLCVDIWDFDESVDRLAAVPCVYSGRVLGEPYIQVSDIVSSHCLLQVSAHIRVKVACMVAMSRRQLLRLIFCRQAELLGRKEVVYHRA